MIMQLSLEKNRAAYQIKGFKPGEIQINDDFYSNSLILLPDRLIPNWGPQQLSQVNLASFEPIINLKPDILLLGTGNSPGFVTQDLTHAILTQGIGFEVMDTAAACRTFNILTAEDRKVAAALIIDA